MPFKCLCKAGSSCGILIFVGEPGETTYVNSAHFSTILHYKLKKIGRQQNIKFEFFKNKKIKNHKILNSTNFDFEFPKDQKNQKLRFHLIW
jgi:hypothetical protein